MEHPGEPSSTSFVNQDVSLYRLQQSDSSVPVQLPVMISLSSANDSGESTITLLNGSGNSDRIQPELQHQHQQQDFQEVPDEEEVDGYWDGNATRLLIEEYKVRKPLVHSRQIPTLKRMWKIIQDSLGQNGFQFTAKQIENRWRTLERAYTKTKLRNGKPGRKKMRFAFQSELDDIMNRDFENHPVGKPRQIPVNSSNGLRNSLPAGDSLPFSYTDPILPEPSATSDTRDLGQQSSDRLVKRKFTKTVGEEVALLRRELARRHTEREQGKQRRHDERMHKFTLLLELLRNK